MHHSAPVEVPFLHLKLLTGRCYGAEIYTKTFFFLPKSKISLSGQNHRLQKGILLKMFSAVITRHWKELHVHVCS